MQTLVICCLLAAGQLAAGEGAEDGSDHCPWKFATGHWRLTDSTGFTADVVWRAAGNNEAVVGQWQTKEGHRGNELVGWRPDGKVLVATGYGSNGSYWQITCTTVTETMITGAMIHRTPDGKVRKGRWQMTRKSDEEMATRFVGTQDGEEVTISGSLTRKLAARHSESTG